jgi:hypothetical protein
MMAGVLSASANAAGVPPADPFRDAVQVWHFKDEAGLKAHGAVEAGVKQKSGARNEDGLIAAFHGGWLDAGNPEVLNTIDDYGFTLHVRLQIPDGQWDKPIISKGGADNEFAWRLYGRPFGHDPKQQSWEMGMQNYWPFGDAEGKGYALEFELGVQPEPLYIGNKYERERKRNPDAGDVQLPPEITNGIFRVGVPVSMIGADAWHDVTVRFNGPKLELFVDGVLVDEEWPIGKIRTSTAPCLIGAADAGGEVVSGFRGEMDHAAVWDRALSAEEIATLSGGPDAVARAENRILGPEQQKSLQYWRPRGHNTWVGDVMPAYDDKEGRFHMFYLYSRRHHGSKWGTIAEVGHASSTDLVHWTQHSRPLTVTRQWETYGTGCPVFLGDRWEFHYGMHTMRMVSAEVTTVSQLNAQLSENGAYSPISIEAAASKEWPLKDVPVGHRIALSKDGVHFEKTNLNLTPSQNMYIWRAPESCDYRMLWGRQMLVSDDLRSWRPVAANLIPTGKQTPANNSGECPCYFEWNGWHYIMMGRSGFWMSRNMEGPYWAGPRGEHKDEVVQPRWDIYEGLIVPMVASYKGNRRLLAGNNPSPSPHQGWAGYLVFRELIQHDDGTLGLQWVEEMIPATGQPIAWKIDAADEAVSSSANTLRLQGDGFRKARIGGLPDSYRITARVVPGDGVKRFGINIGAGTAYAGGCELQFEPAKAHAQWADPDAERPATHVEHILDSHSPHSPYRGGEYAIECVKDLDRPFTLDLIVKYDPTTKVTLADACIDERRTMIANRYDLPGDGLFLFSEGGEVMFRDVVIRPLKN